MYSVVHLDLPNYVPGILNLIKLIHFYVTGGKHKLRKLY